MSNAAKKVAPAANGAPKPTIVPPLEDFNKPPPLRSAPSAPSTGFQPPSMQSPLPTAPQASVPPSPYLQAALSQSSSLGPGRGSSIGGPPSPSSTDTIYDRSEPLSGSSSQTVIAHQATLSHSSSQSSLRGPFPPQSPGAGPSTPSPRQATFPSMSDEPPLGGRLTRSTFVQSTPSPLSAPPLPALASSSVLPGPSSRSFSPLHGATSSQATSAGPLGPPPQNINGHTPQGNGFDPLGQARPNYLSSSLRVQPTRPRLDAREAASKLANMF